jgi:hypothetical protein
VLFQSLTLPSIRHSQRMFNLRAPLFSLRAPPCSAYVLPLAQHAEPAGDGLGVAVLLDQRVPPQVDNVIAAELLLDLRPAGGFQHFIIEAEPAIDALDQGRSDTGTVAFPADIEISRGDFECRRICTRQANEQARKRVAAAKFRIASRNRESADRFHVSFSLPIGRLRQHRSSGRNPSEIPLPSLPRLRLARDNDVDHVR